MDGDWKDQHRQDGLIITSVVMTAMAGEHARSWILSTLKLTRQPFLLFCAASAVSS
jgi:hypothetical protein